jgi:general secretion pathway protein D
MNNNLNKLTTATCFVASLSLASCELLGPNLAAKLPLPPVKQDKKEQDPAIVFKDLQNKKPAADSKAKNEFYPGNDRFVADAGSQKKKAKASGEGSYSLNFDDADLGEVAKVILGDILGQNYVLSPKVAGKVTLQTTEALTKEELLPTLEMVLRMNNAALVKDGKIYHIEPAADALYSSTISPAGRPGYQTRVFPIRNVAVENIAEVLKPLVHDKTILHVDGERNMLIASGTADEMARVQDLINTFDIDVLRGRSFGVFPLAHVEPDTIIKELEDVFSTGGKEDGEFFRFLAVDRLNAIMAITHQARYLRDIENWIFRLDRANTASGGGVNVYKVQNVDAEELASTLNEIFTGGSSTKKEKSAKVAPGQAAGEITNKQPAEKQKVQKTSSAGKKSTSGGDSPLGNVKIIADVINNSLVIVATPQEYEELLPVIKQLDILPLQVLIDATIVDVTLNDRLRYGIKWFLTHENGGRNVIGSGGGSSLNGPNATLTDSDGKTITGASLTNIAATAIKDSFGYSFISNSGDIRAVLNAEATKSNVNVVSSPSLMVLNNQEASIQVGDEISLSTSQSTPLSGGVNTGLVSTNSIQQRKTGVKLKIKPRVNASGLVIMDIEQSVENPGEIPVNKDGDRTGNPSILTREITSSVAVQSGETLVLGGLIKENTTYSKTGVPFLHTLPLIGPLFGGTTKDKDRTELVVLITPRVVQSKQDARLISDEFKRKLTGIYDVAPTYIEKPKTK